MHQSKLQRIVLTIDHEPSTFKAISRLGSNAGFQTYSFTVDTDFLAWIESNSEIAHRKNKAFCIVFDSRFVNIFNRPLPAWVCSTPRICTSRSNKIAAMVNPIQLGLFDFMLKPFHLDDMNNAIEKAFSGFELQSENADPLEPIIERIGQLTRRELEICEKLFEDQSGKEISHELGISVKTYYVHRTNLLQKTGAKSIVELIRAFDIFSKIRRNPAYSNESIETRYEHACSSEAASNQDRHHFPLVSEIARKNILVTDSNLSLRSAANLMIEKDVSSIVFFNQGHPHVFSMENVLEISNADGDFGLKLSSLPVESAKTIEKNKNVLDALDQLEINKNRYLIVVDPDNGDTMIGILTYTDLLSSIDPALLLENKTIGQIVSRTEPLSFTQEWYFEDILCHLVQPEDSVIIVENGKPVGIITSKDAFRIISSGQPTRGHVTQFMTKPVMTLPTSSTIYDALIHLKTNKIKRCIIVDEFGILVGVLPQSEVVGFAYSNWAKMLNHQPGGLRELVDLLTRKAAKHEMEALTDRLTGLWNRRHLENCLESEIKRVRRYKVKTFSELFIDIDHFKAINDRYGHSFGDEVLKSVADTIGKHVRENDKVFRWGGDEFVVLCPCTDCEEAKTLGLRIRENIEKQFFSVDCRVTVSIGCGEFAPHQDTNNFFSHIDQALFRAKASGRNRIEITTFAPLSLADNSPANPEIA